MENWLWCLVGMLAGVAVILWIKIYFMQKSAKEIREGLAYRLGTETNTLLSISGRDKSVRELTDDINRELKKLREERHRFQQGDRELKEAVTNISHDLRTPLTAICGYLDLLEREEKTETVARYLSIIRNRTEALTQLTEELFRYSVVASAKGDIHKEEVVLNHVLEESISAYYAVLKDGRIELEISMPEQKITRLLDREALSRILENVISNAVKYSDGDLHIILSESGEIVFSNHASGMDAVQVGKLFDRFYTVETAKGATGLGLSIAKTLTEQMGGTITADYDKGVIRICLLFSDHEWKK